METTLCSLCRRRNTESGLAHVRVDDVGLMAGRGRGGGRGRGIPITYPDGWASKPHSAGVFSGPLPLALGLDPADKELLKHHRGLHHSSAIAMFTVADPKITGDIARYSDRYRMQPRGQFSKVTAPRPHTRTINTGKLVDCVRSRSSSPFVWAPIFRRSLRRLRPRQLGRRGHTLAVGTLQQSMRGAMMSKVRAH